MDKFFLVLPSAGNRYLAMDNDVMLRGEEAAIQRQ